MCENLCSSVGRNTTLIQYSTFPLACCPPYLLSPLIRDPFRLSMKCCRHLYLRLSWTESQGASKEWRASSLVDLRIALLSFAELVLSASLTCDLQHRLGWFAAKCEEAGMKLRISKSEVMVRCLKIVGCPLWVGSGLLPHV